METIKNYLESMFMTLPNTAEVNRAKMELGQMMEDKYNELISEGKSENEAIGIVISEFGNLDELAEDLGLRAVMSDYSDKNVRVLGMDEIEAFIEDCTRASKMVAIAVFLFIASCAFPAAFSSINVMETISIVMLFVCIAAGVGILIFRGAEMKKWEFLSQGGVGIDYATTQTLTSRRDAKIGTKASFLAIGIALCILSVIPPIFLEDFHMGVMEDMGGALFLIVVAIGVALIIISSGVTAAFDKLLSLNEDGTVGATYTKKGKEKTYSNAKFNKIMSCYWPTVSCIYLAVSFLTFDWHITWIIWPIAGIVNKLIATMID